MDEVLSVGDFRFQEKCEARIQNMKDQGTTILFVSHSIEQVKKNFCNKVVWLDHGVLKMFGDAQEICSIYEKRKRGIVEMKKYIKTGIEF